MVFKKDFLHSKKKLSENQPTVFISIKKPFKCKLFEGDIKKRHAQYQCNPFGTSKQQFLQKEKIPKKKKNTSHRSHNNVKMKMDALITLELTLVKADG